MKPQTADIVVLTVIRPELLAARGGLSEATRVKASNGTVYWYSEVYSHLTEDTYGVALCCIGGAGTPSAAAATVSAISTWCPQIVILLGIAGGIRGKTHIGEVIFSDRVLAYEPSVLAVHDGTPVLEPRPETERPPHRVWQDVVNYNPPTDRLCSTFSALGGQFPSSPQVRDEAPRELVPQTISFRGATVASGDKLFRDPTKMQGLRSQLHGKIEVVEMEAAGLVEACRDQGVPWLVVRGVSDFGDGNKNDHFHHFASSSAAAVVVDFLRYGLELKRPGAAPALPGNADRLPTASHSDPRTSELRVPQFHYGGVVPPDYFVGRVSELQQAEEIVRSRQSFLLVGEARAGKTSFCDALIHRVMGKPGNDVLVGKLNLESCGNLTLDTFLAHTILNMIGEIARQVFRCQYSDLLVHDSQRKRELSSDAAFRSLANVHRLVLDRTRVGRNAARSPLLPQEFLAFTTELLELISGRGWGSYFMVYDEANHLASDLSIDLLMNNVEILNGARLTTAYAASPAMAESFAPLSRYLPCKIHLGPFCSPSEMRQLLGRYCYGDPNRVQDLPTTEGAELRAWNLSGGIPFHLQCLFAFGFKYARQAHEARVHTRHIELAHSSLRKDLAEYFP